jgi:hypothetical protein
MCDCPAIDLMCAAVARLARVRPGTVHAIFGRLERDGDNAARLTAPLLAAAFGWRLPTVDRVMASLASLGVTCDGVVTEMWRIPVANSAGLSMRPSAVRMRNKRLRDREAANHPVANVASPPVTCNAAQPSLSFLEEDLQQQERKQKDARAPDDDGFAAVVAIWPVANRMAEAERVYRDYRRSHDAPTILTAAQRYLAEKPTWQSCMFLVNWLRADPCKEPVLPLTAAPREVAAAKVETESRTPHALGEPGDRIAAKLGSKAFSSWFAPLAIESNDGLTLRLIAPTRFIANMLRQQYDAMICEAWDVRYVTITSPPSRSSPARQPQPAREAG